MQLTASPLEHITDEIADAIADGTGAYRQGFARGIRPDPEISVSRWAEEKRELANEASPRPGKWSNATAPYLTEIMDCLSPEHPCREVTFVKCAQVGGSEVGLNFFGHTVENSPCAFGIFLPTDTLASGYNRTKLQPAIDATKSLRDLIREQKSRSEKGSSKFFKKFPNGFCHIAGTNSSAGLQMFSLKKIIKEEISEWPFDVDGRGDPDELVERALFAYLNAEGVKVFNVSTPGIAKQCRITARYLKSDQRRYRLPCPHCEWRQPLIWARLRFNDKPPYEAVYFCEQCGAAIAHHCKEAMLAAGSWVAENPGPAEPGFHINQLYSPFVSWDDMAKAWCESQGEAKKEKVFAQQRLGEAYVERTDTPDAEKLFARREPYKLRRLPPGTLFITAAADVQGNRIEWAVYAWDRNGTRWLIDKGVIVGDPQSKAPWQELTQISERRYEDANGKFWPIDAFGVDTGHLTNYVYDWVRKHPAQNRIYALKGRGGPNLPPLGTPTKQSIDFDGHKTGSVLLWPVGTWELKTELYGSLRKLIAGPDPDGAFPPGTAHYPEACDYDYFQQLTAEYLDEIERRDGMVDRAWKKRSNQANEAHDIAVYAAALYRFLTDDLTDAEWAQRAAYRALPPVRQQRDLAELWDGAPTQTPADEKPAPPVQAPPSAPVRNERRAEDPREARTRDWF